MAWIHNGRKYWYHNGKKCSRSLGNSVDEFNDSSDSFISLFYTPKKRSYRQEKRKRNRYYDMSYGELSYLLRKQRENGTYQHEGKTMEEIFSELKAL